MINFWLPLVPAHANNTLWVEDFTLTSDDADSAAAAAVAPAAASAATTTATATATATPLEGVFGDCWQFYGNGAAHYTVPNDTARTRISLDFRCVPGPFYHNDWAPSRGRKNGSQAFFCGGYYARLVKRGGGWKCFPAIDP